MIAFGAETGGGTALPDGAEDPWLAIVVAVAQGLLRAPVGPDDDFFEAGGDSLRAMKFVLELEKILIMPVPPGLVLAGRSPRGMTRRLRDVRSMLSRQIEPLRITRGDTRALFILGGIDGTCEETRCWLMAWPAHWSIYGVIDRAAVSAEAPVDTLDALADQAADAILASGRAGPFHLLGYSFGGLLAYETAVHLRRREASVGFLGLIDTPSLAAPENIQQEGEGTAHSLVEARLRASRERAPSAWEGAVTLFRATENMPGAAPDYLWSRFAPGVEVVPIAGTHESFCSAGNLPGLARVFADTVRAQAGAAAPLTEDVIHPNPLRGFVDCVAPNLIEGWAQSANAPEWPVTLELVVDDTVAARFRANLERPDLAEAGYGSGRHGFSYQPKTPLTAAQCETAYVRRVRDGVILGRSAPPPPDT